MKAKFAEDLKAWHDAQLQPGRRLPLYPNEAAFSSKKYDYPRELETWYALLWRLPKLHDVPKPHRLPKHDFGRQCRRLRSLTTSFPFRPQGAHHNCVAAWSYEDPRPYWTLYNVPRPF